MNKYNINIDVRPREVISLNGYSVSDNFDTLLGNIISLINNIKRDSFIYELSHENIIYITKDNVKLLGGSKVSLNNGGKRNLFISLTNDINSLVECLFYIAINYRDVDSIEYLIYNYVNEENIKNMNIICTECHVEPLKYIILNNYNDKLSLKYLVCRSISNTCNYEDINKLQIPRELREYIINILKEIFYGNNYINHFIYHNYPKVIQKFGLQNIVNHKLLVKGVKEYKCNIHRSCGYTNGKYKRKNYILYFEVLSYDARAHVNNKYASIKFHEYKRSCYGGKLANDKLSSMKCEILEQLPPYYDLIPKRSVYISITAGSFNEMERKIENEVFIFVEAGINFRYTEGYYKLNLELFVKHQYINSNKRKKILSRDITCKTSSNNKRIRRNKI